MRALLAPAAGVVLLAAGGVIGTAAGSVSKVSGWKLTDLGTAPGYRHVSVIANRPVAVNARGEVVGTSEIPDHGRRLSSGIVQIRERAFVWQRGKLTDLGNASVAAVNDEGEIVGSGASGHALLWRQGKKTDLGTLGGRWSEAVGINDQGQVVGTSALPGSTLTSFRQHAFLWQRGKMTDLGTLGGANSRAIAINDQGRSSA